MVWCKAHKITVSGLFFMIILSALSCKKDNAGIPDTGKLHPVSLATPANFPPVVPDEYNQLTTEGIALGRMLFYDKRLSASNQISCASCHHQEIAFSDGISLSSAGESGKKLLRHAPALINLAWMKNGLFWDGGSTNLESQAFAPLTDANEMHQNLTELEYELKAIPQYVQSFKRVFGREVKSADIVKALAQFERTLISGDSKYDRYARKEKGAVLTTQELDGLTIVNKSCKGCHSGELFTDDSYHNNGIDADFTNDAFEGVYQGRYRISYNPADLGKFRTPTLRNVMLTAPYMHDGRFTSITEVLEHYAQHIKISPTTDPLLYQYNGTVGVPLSNADKTAVIAFLNTLTDQNFVNNPNLSNPY
jgi:cytochrome c peroxidase